MQSSSRSDPVSIFQLLVSAIGLLLGLLIAAVVGLVGLVGVFGETVPLSESVGVFTFAWVAALVAALAVPSLAYTFLRLSNRSFSFLGAFQGSQTVLGYRLSWALILLWPLILALGSVIAKSERLAWIILPPMSLLAIAIPVWWAVEIARYRLPQSGPKRGWGSLNFTLFLSTPLIMLVEVVGFVFVLVLVIIVVSANPEWVSAARIFALRLDSLQDDPERLLVELRPLLQNPMVVYLILSVLSGMAPLVEELFKPLALWLLVGRRISPAQGFALGAVCGGTFALIESLLNISNPSSNGWTSLVVARSGTAVLHTATTALVGWGMASAWSQGAYLRLGMAYLSAVLLHGTWNGLGVLTMYATIVDAPAQDVQWIFRIAPAAPVGLGILVIIHLLLLWGGNRILQREAQETLPALESGSSVRLPTE